MKYFLERLLSKEKLKRKRNCYIEFTFTEQAEKHAKFARVSELEVYDGARTKKDTERQM